MTQTEALKLALEALEDNQHLVADNERHAYVMEYNDLIEKCKEALAQPQQEPVAMKFKIYKPTVPDPVRQGINNALLPWVYDQDRSSGFDASMWVTPVATLTPQRKPLTHEQRFDLLTKFEPHKNKWEAPAILIDMVEAAHGIKEKNT